MKKPWIEHYPLSVDSADLLWRPADWILPRPQPALQSWLLDPGSLTQRLKEHSDGQFRVRVLEEKWVQRTSPSLLQCFPVHLTRCRMWSRKVLLQCGDLPWVMAHSLIPVTTMVGELRCLRRLSDRPLGEFLFRDPLLQRSQLEVTRWQGIYGRRSLFHLQGRPLLVAEFFLPALLEGRFPCDVGSDSP